MRILLTGAAGFIGSHTAELLTEERHKVLALDNFSTGRIDNLAGLPILVESCDVRDYKKLEVVFNKFRPDVILHLAAQSAITTAWKNPDRDMQVNIHGTLNLLMLAMKYQAKKFVFSSTSAVYGNGNRWSASTEKDRCEPNTPYGISKLAAEHYIKLLFPNHVILRYANVYGPRQRPIGENQVIARAFNHFIHGENFAIVGSGKQKRDFVYVSDIAHANYLAVSDNAIGVYNVASGKSHSVNDVLWQLEDKFNVNGYRWDHTEKQDERGSVYLSGAKIRKFMGWKATVNLTTGIALTADWWRDAK